MRKDFKRFLISSQTINTQKLNTNRETKYTLQQDRIQAPGDWNFSNGSVELTNKLKDEHVKENIKVLS
jgi:hypothetical protein